MNLFANCMPKPNPNPNTNNTNNTNTHNTHNNNGNHHPYSINTYQSTPMSLLKNCIPNPNNHHNHNNYDSDDDVDHHDTIVRPYGTTNTTTTTAAATSNPPPFLRPDQRRKYPIERLVVFHLGLLPVVNDRHNHNYHNDDDAADGGDGGDTGISNNNSNSKTIRVQRGFHESASMEEMSEHILYYFDNTPTRRREGGDDDDDDDGGGGGGEVGGDRHGVNQGGKRLWSHDTRSISSNHSSYPHNQPSFFPLDTATRDTSVVRNEAVKFVNLCRALYSLPSAVRSTTTTTAAATTTTATTTLNNDQDGSGTTGNNNNKDPTTTRSSSSSRGRWRRKRRKHLGTEEVRLSTSTLVFVPLEEEEVVLANDDDDNDNDPHDYSIDDDECGIIAVVQIPHPYQQQQQQQQQQTNGATTTTNHRFRTEEIDPHTIRTVIQRTHESFCLLRGGGIHRRLLRLGKHEKGVDVGVGGDRSDSGAERDEEEDEIDDDGNNADDDGDDYESGGDLSNATNNNNNDRCVSDNGTKEEDRTSARKSCKQDQEQNQNPIERGHNDTRAVSNHSTNKESDTNNISNTVIDEEQRSLPNDSSKTLSYDNIDTESKLSNFKNNRVVSFSDPSVSFGEEEEEEGEDLNLKGNRLASFNERGVSFGEEGEEGDDDDDNDNEGNVGLDDGISFDDGNGPRGRLYTGESYVATEEEVDEEREVGIRTEGSSEYSIDALSSGSVDHNVVPAPVVSFALPPSSSSSTSSVAAAVAFTPGSYPGVQAMYEQYRSLRKLQAAVDDLRQRLIPPPTPLLPSIPTRPINPSYRTPFYHRRINDCGTNVTATTTTTKDGNQSTIPQNTFLHRTIAEETAASERLTATIQKLSLNELREDLKRCYDMLVTPQEEEKEDDYEEEETTNQGFGNEKGGGDDGNRRLRPSLPRRQTKEKGVGAVLKWFSDPLAVASTGPPSSTSASSTSASTPTSTSTNTSTTTSSSSPATSTVATLHGIQRLTSYLRSPTTPSPEEEPRYHRNLTKPNRDGSPTLRSRRRVPNDKEEDGERRWENDNLGCDGRILGKVCFGVSVFRNGWHVVTQRNEGGSSKRRRRRNVDSLPSSGNDHNNNIYNDDDDVCDKEPSPQTARHLLDYMSSYQRDLNVSPKPTAYPPHHTESVAQRRKLQRMRQGREGEGSFLSPPPPSMLDVRDRTEDGVYVPELDTAVWMVEIYLPTSYCTIGSSTTGHDFDLARSNRRRSRRRHVVMYRRGSLDIIFYLCFSSKDLGVAAAGERGGGDGVVSRTLLALAELTETSLATATSATVVVVRDGVGPGVTSEEGTRQSITPSSTSLLRTVTSIPSSLGNVTSSLFRKVTSFVTRFEERKGEKGTYVVYVDGDGGNVFVSSDTRVTSGGGDDAGGTVSSSVDGTFASFGPNVPFQNGGIVCNTATAENNGDTRYNGLLHSDLIRSMSRRLSPFAARSFDEAVYETYLYRARASWEDDYDNEDVFKLCLSFPECMENGNRFSSCIVHGRSEGSHDMYVVFDASLTVDTDGASGDGNGTVGRREKVDTLWSWFVGETNENIGDVRDGGCG